MVFFMGMAAGLVLMARLLYPRARRTYRGEWDE